VRGLREVLEIDPGRLRIDAEGMVPYARLTELSLPTGVMPAVVPQLKSITLGGAVAGVGIESSSFRYGLVHETVDELEVLTGSGEVVLCRRDNAHRDLFYGFPNSYGTLGYALRVTANAVPVKRYVRLEHQRYSDPKLFFLALQAELTSTEDRIASARRYYNATVRDLNTKVETVPTNVVAGLFHIERAEYFEAAGEQREAPRVDFGQREATIPPPGSYRGSEPPTTPPAGPTEPPSA